MKDQIRNKAIFLVSMLTMCFACFGVVYMFSDGAAHKLFGVFCIWVIAASYRNLTSIVRETVRKSDDTEK